MASKPALATVLHFLVVIVCKKKCTLHHVIIASTTDLGGLGLMPIFIYFFNVHWISSH